MKYIVDTNFLLQNPQVIEQYDVVIPSHVNNPTTKVVGLQAPC